MLSVKGRFVDGVARPVEPVEGYDQEEVIITFLRSEEDAERAEFAEWKGASARTLQGVWDNDKDAVYDRLLGKHAMTLTLEIPVEAQSWLEAAAQEHGQAADEYVRESFRIWLILTMPETENTAFQEMRALSLPTLEEYWINEHDAVYDTL